MNRNKKIVLITTGQPSVNPRIVKEANALSDAGHVVTLLYCYWINWALNTDGILFRNVKWDHKLVGGNPVNQKWKYFYTKARNKINQLLNKNLGNRFLFAERSQARCYDELLKAAKSIKADWYVGHNLGALSIAVKSATFHHAKCGFDFEDYHREENYNMPLYQKKRIAYLEEKYVNCLQYFSTASPMITARVQQNFVSFKAPVITLLNCFPLSQQSAFREKLSEDNTLQLFWFSQTIGKNRGLEIIIKVLNKLNDHSIFLTLAGKSNEDFKMFIEQNAMNIKNNIHLAGIIQPEELPAFASQFDVGLAIELNSPENRSICLTNKIFIYLLAGNAIIFSNTIMQKSFNDVYHAGEIFSNDNEKDFESKIIFYKDRRNLKAQRLHNYNLASSKLNWESESKKLLSVIS